MFEPIPLHPLTEQEEIARLQDMLAQKAVQISTMEADFKRKLAQKDAQIRQIKDDLRTMAYEDALTGIGNLRALKQALSGLDPYELFCIVYIDLDNYGEINNKHGHRIGDRVLEKFGSILRSKARDGDLVARKGGDEFVAILRHCDMDNAVSYVERLLNAIRADMVFHGQEGGTFSVTASIGLAGHRVGEDVSDTLDRADQALYAAKGKGRDCFAW